MASNTKNKTSSEKPLSETAEMFQAIAELGNIGILILDEEGHITFANALASHITGYEAERLLGKSFIEFLDEKNTRIFKTLKESSSDNINNMYQGVEIGTAPSKPVLTEMSLASYALPSGEKNSFVYIRDISVRKRLRKELEESEKKYRELFDRVDQGIYISTKEGKFTDCNEAMLRILGYDSKEEFLKIDIAQDLYVNPEDRRKFQETVEKDGFVKNYEVEFKKKNGENIPILLTADVRKNEEGEVIGYQGLNIDISERIAMQRAVEEKNRFLSKLLDSSVDCIVAADTKGTVIFFNKAAERLTGYTPDEVIGKFNITKFYPLEVAKDIMRKLRGDDFGGRGRLESFRITLHGKGGQEIPVSTSASIVYEGDKELASLGVFTDLREKIKMEKELQETQMRLIQS